MIRENLENVRGNINIALENTENHTVDLVAVSKTKPFDMIVEAYENGARLFGENKADELRKKYELAGDMDIDFHFIGHLQRNKVKYIVDKVALIHSLDSYRLAEKIDQEAKKKDCKVDILVQINIGEEDSKFGIPIEEAESFIDSISDFENIRVKGLMCIAPYVEDGEENRALFRKMHEVFIDIKKKNKDNVFMDVLSMGMSGDYMVAIEEGATMVRVGSAIFGERNYN